MQIHILIVPIIPEKKIHFQGLFLKHLFLDKDFITAHNLIYYVKNIIFLKYKNMKLLFKYALKNKENEI